MIIQCNETHRTKVVDYLKAQREFNLFFIADIEHSGFDSEFQKIYLDEDDEGIHTVYLIFHENLLITSATNKVNVDFVTNVLMNRYLITCVSGNQECINMLPLENYSVDDCYFCKMTGKNISTSDEIEVAKVEDCDEVREIIKMVFKHDSPRLGENIEKKIGRTYFIKKDNKIVSVASSNSEIEGLAMIVGVATLEDYRGKGYASEVVKKLCFDLILEDKIPCLFYNNPAAGKIYHRLGFEDMGKWAMRRKITE